MAGQTLYDKLWNAHEVTKRDDGSSLIYIDRHLLHEVTSPQAFEGLKLSKRPVRNKHSILATLDHCVPTKMLDRIFASSEKKSATLVKDDDDDEKAPAA